MFKCSEFFLIKKKKRKKWLGKGITGMKILV